MKTLTQIFPQSARLLTITALAGLCVAGFNIQAATLAPANPAPASPANIATAPASSQPTLDQDIRDIRPPYHIPPGWLWLAWVGGGLALAALGYGAWRWRNRLGLRVKLPYEIALEQLEEHVMHHVRQHQRGAEQEHHEKPLVMMELNGRHVASSTGRMT